MGRSARTSADSMKGIAKRWEGQVSACEYVVALPGRSRRARPTGGRVPRAVRESTSLSYQHTNEHKHTHGSGQSGCPVFGVQNDPPRTTTQHTKTHKSLQTHTRTHAQTHGHMLFAGTR